MRTILPSFGTHLVRYSLVFSNIYESHGLRDCLSKIVAYSTLGKPSADIKSSRLDNHDWKKKIVYNDVMHGEKKVERKRILDNIRNRREELHNHDAVTKAEPLFLKCMSHMQELNSKDNSDSECVIQFPYESHKKVLIATKMAEEDLEPNVMVDDAKTVDYDMQLSKIKKGEFEFKHEKQWQDEEDEGDNVYDDTRFGSCDPNIPVSNVPCGGCGALLHCKDVAIPGFLPKEIFQDMNEAALRGITCQRCLFLQEYNVALGINVNPDEYPKILSQIKTKGCLVILMVDLLDFPCSIWPNIMDVIGYNRPLFIVGNKMDLIIQDDIDFIKHRKECLKNALESAGINLKLVKHISLISAKTGYGVENLITNLQNIWGTKGDIYIAGCTNAGKSTLFNSLIQSDFCKTKATDILQRATVSQWPGTTLNLLKFPILKPLSWRRAVRSQRLNFTEKQMKAFRKLQISALGGEGKQRQVSLMGYIGRSFGKEESSGRIGLDPDDEHFRHSKWCYDTPGVVHESQILNLFTTEELTKVLPNKTIIPRNFKLLPGNALFIGGIARLDLIKSNGFVWFTVFASVDLPVTVTYIEDADFIYQKLLGTHMFCVPFGGKKRLEKWPKLASEDVCVVGTMKRVAAADVVLSSAGWVAITIEPATSCNLRAWTPDGRGIFAREPPLIKHSSMYRSSKIRGTPAYYPSIEIVDSSDVFSEEFQNL